MLDQYFRLGLVMLILGLAIVASLLFNLNRRVDVNNPLLFVALKSDGFTVGISPLLTLVGLAIVLYFLLTGQA